MLLSFTIATLAAALGSKLFSSNSEQETEQEYSASLEDKEFDQKQDNVSITEMEQKEYTFLAESLVEAKNLKTVQESVKNIESVYWKTGLLKGNENEEYICQLLLGRFRTFTKSQSFKYAEKADEINDIIEQLKDYIEFLFVKTNKMALENFYKKELVKGNIEAKLNKMSASELETYRERFDNVFIKIMTADKKITEHGLKQYKYCYYDLLNDAGKVHKELMFLNEQIGCVHDPKVFSTIIVDEIAETILNNTNFYFCRDLTPSVLSKDLVHEIINYIHHNQPMIEDGENLNSFAQKLEQNYFSNRTIHHYYYFLILCARFVGSLRTNWEKKKIMLEVTDEKKFNEKAKSILFAQIGKHNYKFLRGMSQDDIWEHIQATKAENKTEN